MNVQRADQAAAFIGNQLFLEKNPLFIAKLYDPSFSLASVLDDAFAHRPRQVKRR